MCVHSSSNNVESLAQISRSQLNQTQQMVNFSCVSSPWAMFRYFLQHIHTAAQQWEFGCAEEGGKKSWQQQMGREDDEKNLEAEIRTGMKWGDFTWVWVAFGFVSLLKPTFALRFQSSQD